MSTKSELHIEAETYDVTNDGDGIPLTEMLIHGDRQALLKLVEAILKDINDTWENTTEVDAAFVTVPDGIAVTVSVTDATGHAFFIPRPE